jgi:hypothetical protein
MTLILSVLTRDCVIQVSDRRLVSLDTGCAVEDERNKTVLWCGRLSFGFTGLANLGVEQGRTDLWLAETLASVETAVLSGDLTVERFDQRQLLEQLAARCTTEFRRMTIAELDPQMRRHAFVAVGWARFDEETDFAPYLAHVSNVYSPDLSPLREPSEEFVVWWKRLEPSDDGFFFAEGQGYDEEETTATVQLLGALWDAYKDPAVIVEALVEKVRGKAAAPRSAVGKGMLVNVLPRGALREEASGRMVLLSEPLADQQTFMYLPSDTALPGVAYGPTYTCGGSITADFQAIGA